MSEEESQTAFTFQLPITLKDRAERDAQRLGLGLSGYIRLAIIEKLEKKANQP